MTKFIAIASGKGGTGKTVTALNLGAALNFYKKEVIVVDANIHTPHIGIHLGAHKVPIALNDALSGRNHIKDATYQHASGLKVIPASLSYEVVRSSRVENFPHVMLDLMGLADYVILDSPAGLSNELWHVMTSADEVLIATNPDLSCVTDALRAIRFAQESGTEVSGIVLTRVRGDSYELSDEEISGLLEKPIIGRIPEDRKVLESLKQKHPVVYSHPDASSSLAYKRLARSIIDGSYRAYLQEEDKKSLMNHIFKGTRRID